MIPIFLTTLIEIVIARSRAGKVCVHDEAISRIKRAPDHSIVLHTNNMRPDLFIDFYQLLYSIEGVIFGCSHFAARLA